MVKTKSILAALALPGDIRICVGLGRTGKCAAACGTNAILHRQ